VRMLRGHPRSFHPAWAVAHEAIIDPVEAEARAIIAAALIVRGAESQLTVGRSQSWLKIKNPEADAL
jgi:hypothetical protein